MTINSRQKGKNGELELCEVLRTLGVDARRGQQYSGGNGDADIVSGLEGIHWECKRVEAGSLYTWLAQAIRDCGQSIPVVAHRRSRKDWVCILRLEDFAKMAKELEELRAQIVDIWKDPFDGH